MKKLLTLVTVSLLVLGASAAPSLNAQLNGIWRSNSVWSLNRAPEANDTVVIPYGKIVTVDNNWSLNGDLFIKVYGTLRFAGGGAKLIIGGGSRVLVYAGGLIDGGGSPSQILNIGGNTVYQGNQTDITGPAMASATSTGFDPFNPLPVKFIGFSLTRKSSEVLVQWSTSEELNADRYELERSFDGASWNTIALIAAAGNSSAVQNYSYSDRSAGSRSVYYRIRQVDVDGRFTYTPVKSVRNSTTTDVQIAAVNGKLLLQFPAEVKGAVELRFVNLNGQVIARQSLNNPTGQVIVNTQLTGNYVIALGNGADFQAARQVRL